VVKQPPEPAPARALPIFATSTIGPVGWVRYGVLTLSLIHDALNGMQEEQSAISALTGFSLNHLLTDLSLPSNSNLAGRLGISGIPNLSSDEIYNDKWGDDDGAVGRGAGKDYEAEVDAELQDDQEDFDVKMEEEDVFEEERPPKRMKTVTRLVERPKTVNERFPTFEKGKVLDFTELLKGVSIHKSRISKRPFHGMQ
jgi:transcription initiation factor TFIID subunit 1